MTRIDYIRYPSGRLMGFAICVKAPDPPQHPWISKMGWPDPVGRWVYHESPEGPGSITLRSGICGTGSLTCIGFPDDLASYLNLALEKWITERVKDAEARLETLGVDLAA